jgi:hypothetical protein
MMALGILTAAILLATAYSFVAARAEIRRQEWRRQNRAFNLKHPNTVARVAPKEVW